MLWRCGDERTGEGHGIRCFEEREIFYEIADFVYVIVLKLEIDGSDLVARACCLTLLMVWSEEGA